MAGARRRLAGSTPAAGFTLLELCICLVIAAVLAALSAPVANLLRDTAMATATNQLIAHLALARSEAIKRRVRVMMCPSRNGRDCLAPAGAYTLWQDGWLVYADANGNGRAEAAEIVRVHAGSENSFIIRTSRFRRKVTYQPLGTAGGSTVTFAVCAEREPQRARYVTISNTGRARVSRATGSSVQCE